MRRAPPENPIPEPNLLPFLDLVFAFIGILIVIHALQAPSKPQSGRPPAIDDLAVCLTDGQVRLYPGPDAEPILYAESEFKALFERLALQGEGTRNLAFALTRDCYGTRRVFEESFARFASLLEARTERRRLFRLSFRPLSSAPEALPRLLTDWRGTESPRGH
ncbi:hypothetical protein [Thiocystis violacea]|uniref:hypothetical protein n=1 Tax=Thiocystis violacea TaxID=13725 RepID=UPI001908AD01|nr:hypothetical protein [Thiocystis violacea]MBK1719441.1 hypothetical protein [Thiocystis violacea]